MPWVHHLSDGSLHTDRFPSNSEGSGFCVCWPFCTCVGSRGAVVSAALSERKVAGSIPTIGDFHTVGPCKKAVFACLATDVK